MFSDPHAIAGYAEGAMQKVPGLLDMQRMARLLLEERVPADGTVLVLGAGGGMELRCFAEAQPGWHFRGIDPSMPMLDMARQTLGPLASRVAFTEGYIDDAPDEPCDGAACLLTLHFLPAEQRLHTLKEVRRRLKPGAPLVVAHHSYAQDVAQKRRWLQRFAAFSASSGIALDVAHTVDSMARLLPALSPEQDVALLHEAGFGTVELFYAAFSFRGWVAYAG
ncbi:class I SAM-dependent methyltransferase [Stenotrophomonas sp. CFBP 13724]|uniref:class I SAM-dependent methyltransferase n=1 Tax=Stenotrophomonas sp. CFBP 13724 TaxID=2775298 RepID=UPI001787318A|nr:class I SAM-dependent methyltransferase [Stenotrophomonas sp. CFBP 13724]MBD8642621.1 class I SAM-dependent methyltransferase [Stenotrophomonas sp. CFBP 13724]